jgi:hypothetical protein
MSNKDRLRQRVEELERILELLNLPSSGKGELLDGELVHPAVAEMMRRFDHVHAAGKAEGRASGIAEGRKQMRAGIAAEAVDTARGVDLAGTHSADYWRGYRDALECFAKNIAGAAGLAEGRERVAELETIAKAAEDSAGEYFEDAKRAEARVAALEAALKRFGRHTKNDNWEWCPRHWVDEDCGEDGSVCECGLDEVLR